LCEHKPTCRGREEWSCRRGGVRAGVKHGEDRQDTHDNGEDYSKKKDEEEEEEGQGILSRTSGK